MLELKLSSLELIEDIGRPEKLMFEDEAGLETIFAKNKDALKSLLLAEFRVAALSSFHSWKAQSGDDKLHSLSVAFSVVQLPAEEGKTFPRYMSSINWSKRTWPVNSDGLPTFGETNLDEIGAPDSEPLEIPTLGLSTGSFLLNEFQRAVAIVNGGVAGIGVLEELDVLTIATNIVVFPPAQDAQSNHPRLLPGFCPRSWYEYLN